MHDLRSDRQDGISLFPVAAQAAAEPYALSFVVVAEDVGLALAVLRSLPAATREFFLIAPPGLSAIKYSRLCRQFFPFDCSKPDGNREPLVSILKKIEESSGRDLFVVPVGEEATRIVWSAAKQMEMQTFPLPPPTVVDTLGDKWRFMQLCGDLGLPVPATAYVGDKSEFDFDAASSSLGEKIVIKPTNLQRSLGLRIVGSSEEYDRKVRCNAEYKFSPLVAQRYISGSDIDISVLADKGEILHFAVQRAVGDKIEFMEDARVYELTVKLVRAIGYTGVLHLDGRIDAAGGFHFVEANPRFWGSLMAATWCGLNFVEAGISLARGESSAYPRTIAGKSAQGMRRILTNLALGKTLFADLDRHQRGLLKRIICDPGLSLLLHHLLTRSWRLR